MSPPKIPFIASRYLGRTVFLDELQQVSEKDLHLLDAEVHGLHQDCSRSLESGDIAQADWGVVEKLLRTSSRFLYALEQEKGRRDRQESVLSLYKQLEEVKAECEYLKARLREVVA
jgi:hypothetical protein